MAMTDHDALVQLNHEYASAVRTGVSASQAWGETWAPDGRWELPGRAVEGRDAIVELWCAAMGRYAHVVQMYMSPCFDVEGDAATGRIQLLELTQAADGSRATMAGHYDDEYVRTSNGWRFAARTLAIYYHGAPDLSGMFIPS